jgi:hypothetical protein
MTRAALAVGVLATGLAVLAVVVVAWDLARDLDSPSRVAPAVSVREEPAAPPVSPGASEGFLYGRVTTGRGVTYEGRLRWGGDEEAFWGDYFNGTKDQNRWLDQVPDEQLPRSGGRPLEVFGLEIRPWGRGDGLARPFMARFGDIARIEASGADVRVTLKSGTVFDLDRFEASDFDDGVRVWDPARGVVDVDPGRIAAVELLPTPALAVAPERLQGTVTTRQGAFTGFLQWNREKSLGTDQLHGEASAGALSLRFGAIRSIARRTRESARVTLRDGHEVLLSADPETGHAHRGLYVDDLRYGRVLVPWDAVERVDFDSGGSGPAYGEFPPGHPLTGRLVTRDGNEFTGRLVWDLDESETTETLDAPSGGVDYTIPFGLVAAIVLPGHEDAPRRARVTLHGGEEVEFDRSGDLDEANTGVLVFVDTRAQPQFVPWSDVAAIHFDRPPSGYPPLR